MNDANDDVAQRLDRLESKDAIRELTASYCFAVAEGRGADIVAMFTADGRFKMRGREWSGTAGLEEMYLGMSAETSPKPYIQNHVIDGTGTRPPADAGWRFGWCRTVRRTRQPATTSTPTVESTDDGCSQSATFTRSTGYPLSLMHI